MTAVQPPKLLSVSTVGMQPANIPIVSATTTTASCASPCDAIVDPRQYDIPVAANLAGGSKY